MLGLLKNFIRGAGSILDLMPSNPPRKIELPESFRQTDAERLASDWKRVGDSLRKCMQKNRG